MSIFPPNTDNLILAGQVNAVAVVVVVSLYIVLSPVKEPLGAALWGQVIELAGILGHLRNWTVIFNPYESMVSTRHLD